MGVTYTGAQTAGNTNIVAIGWNNATSNITSVTDSAGNTYQLAVPTARGSGVSQAIYYAKNIKAAAAGTNTVTVTFNTATPYVDVRALEYSGLDPVNPFDVGTSASGTGTTASSGTVTHHRGQCAGLRGRHDHRWVLHGGHEFHHPHHHHPRCRHRRGPDGHLDRRLQRHRTVSGAWVMQVAAFKAAAAAGGDTTPPTVAVTAPTGTVSGTVTVTATATDNVGVAGVQFLVDNNPLAAEDTTSPYSVTWNTTTVANGAHTLTALARDTSGNTACRRR